MRIGSLIHNFFHHHNANFVNANTNSPAMLPARLDAAAKPHQIRELDIALATIRELPGGAVLLDALRVHAEVTGKRPHIVLIQDRGLPKIGQVSNETWHVNPQSLRQHPERGLKVVARLYENISQVRLGRFHGVATEQLPRPEPDLQKRWHDWVQEGTASEKRFDAVRAAWRWFEETTYYGGIDYDQMIILLNYLALNEQIPAHLYAELNLSGLSLKELPEMPPGVYALRADNNDLTTLEHVPDDLRMLRLNGALKLAGGPALSQQLRALPDKLVELELDGDNLDTLLQVPGIERWTLPKHLKLLSLRHNGLSTLPILQSELVTLFASDNRLMNLPDRTLEKATGLQEADFRHNDMSFVPGAIQRLPRSCRIDLSGNPMLVIAYQIADRDGVSFEIARSRVVTELRRMRGPNTIYNADREEPAPTPNADELDIPAKANPVILENEVGYWVGAKRMGEVAELWRNIAKKDGSGYFVQMLRSLRLESANRINPGFRENLAEYLTEFIRPERATLQEMTLNACDERRSRCVDHATMALVQLKMLLANDDVRRGAYDHRPKELVELAKQFFTLDILTTEAIAKGNVLYRGKTVDSQEYVETVLKCYVYFREKLGLSLVVPRMNYAHSSGLDLTDLRAIETTVQKKYKEFPYFLVEWEGWQDMLKRNYSEEYVTAESQRYADLERLDLHITQALQRKGLDSANESLRDRESVFVNRKMNYERMAPVTRAYLEFIGAQKLASQVAPRQAPAMDEKIIIGPI
jgi:hypothetical protein